MIGRRSFLFLAATALGAPGLGGCVSACLGCGTPTILRFTYRYRLTLEVATPEGVQSGSSVHEVLAITTIHEGKRHAGGGTTGEAVAVDLGPRGVLFALLKQPPGSGGASEISYDVVSRAGVTRLQDEPYTDFARRVAAYTDVIEVHPADLPMLVRFRDINNPATVEKVDPNNLAKSFGAGVKLQRATLQITSDPVTTGIEKRLGWLNLPFEARRKVFKGPLWDADDPGYSYDKRLLLQYFTTGDIQ